MKDLYLIGGTMGVGKTAACQRLKEKLDNSIFLDGDWCWNSNPWIVTDETKAMVLDNICYLLNSFLQCSVYTHVIFCWVMHEQEIIDTIISRLKLKNCRIHKISLICDETELKRRLMKDVEQGIRDEACIADSLSRCCLYERLNTYKIDVSRLSVEETVKKIIAYASSTFHVSFKGNFWSKIRGEAPFQEIPLNKPFQWGTEQWHAFGAYIFPDGLVLDYGFCIDVKIVKAFLEQWDFIEGREDELSDEQIEQLEGQNPLNLTVRPKLWVNGQASKNRQSCGAVWLPESVKKGFNDCEIFNIVKHYGLDQTVAWNICRTSFEWGSAFNQPENKTVKELLLRLDAAPKAVAGPHFTTPGNKDEVLIKSPVNGCIYTLKILDCCPQKLSEALAENEDMYLPEHFWRLRYVTEPPVSQKEMVVRDCEASDQPRPKKEGSSAVAASVAVIGGCVGAFPVYTSKEACKKDGYTVFSSPHFSLAPAVEWRTVFYTSDRAPVEVLLLKEGVLHDKY
mgnify:CR=1 FL=1